MHGYYQPVSIGRVFGYLVWKVLLNIYSIWANLISFYIINCILFRKSKSQNITIKVLRHRKQRIHYINILLCKENYRLIPRLIVNKAMKILFPVVIANNWEYFLVVKLQKVWFKIPGWKYHWDKCPLKCFLFSFKIIFWKKFI